MATRAKTTIRGRHLALGRDVGGRKAIIAKGGYIAGGEDGEQAVVLPGPNTPAIFEDFVHQSHAIFDTGYASLDFKVHNGDTGQTPGALQALTNGVWRILSAPSATAALAPGSTAGISGRLLWKANMGKNDKASSLYFATRLKLASVSRTTNRLHVFAGFTDVDSTEHPIYDSGAGVITTASNAVGFMFSPGGDTGWSAVAVNGDSDATPQALDTGVAAGVYDELAFEIVRSAGDTGGTAYFWVNGKLKGTIDAAVASATALAPVVYAFQQDTGSQFVDVDYVNVAAVNSRDTGT